MLKEAAQKTFFDMLKARGEKLLRYPPPVAVDLSPPSAVREGVSLFCEIIEIHESMMVPASGKTTDFHPVISAFLDPIIQVITISDDGIYQVHSVACFLILFTVDAQL